MGERVPSSDAMPPALPGEDHRLQPALAVPLRLDDHETLAEIEQSSHVETANRGRARAAHHPQFDDPAGDAAAHHLQVLEAPYRDPAVDRRLEFPAALPDLPGVDRRGSVVGNPLHGRDQFQEIDRTLRKKRLAILKNTLNKIIEDIEIELQE